MSARDVIRRAFRGVARPEIDAMFTDSIRRLDAAVCELQAETQRLQEGWRHAEKG